MAMQSCGCRTLWGLFGMADWKGLDPSQWAELSIKKARNVQRLFVEELANSMAWTVTSGGFTPVDTGNLSRSVTISLRPLNRDPSGYHSPTRQDYSSTVKGLPYDGVTYVSYKAAYAHRLNYGFVGADSLGRMYNQAGRGFLEQNIARAPDLLQKVVKRLQSEN